MWVEVQIPSVGLETEMSLDTQAAGVAHSTCNKTIDLEKR